MRRFFFVIGVLGALPHAALSQSRDSSKTPRDTLPSVATPACCAIVRVESAQTIVVARETATGFTFRFSVKNRRLLATLKIGQPVWADFAAKTVKLKATDEAACCTIVEPPPPPKPDSLGASAQPSLSFLEQLARRR